jgi:hypothetical protein
MGQQVGLEVPQDKGGEDTLTGHPRSDTLVSGHNILWSCSGKTPKSLGSVEGPRSHAGGGWNNIRAESKTLGRRWRHGVVFPLLAARRPKGSHDMHVKSGGSST